MIGISNEPIDAIQEFIEDQGITFPILHDDSGTYGDYNLPGAESPYPRDFILDEDGIIRLAKTEYEPGSMIAVIESLLADPSTVVDPKPTTIPQSPVLSLVYPNPFNPGFQVSIKVAEAQNIRMDLLDIRGRHLMDLMPETELSRGSHRFSVEPGFLPSGVYLLRVSSPQSEQIRKVMRLN